MRWTVAQFSITRDYDRERAGKMIASHLQIQLRKRVVLWASGARKTSAKERWGYFTP